MSILLFYTMQTYRLYALLFMEKFSKLKIFFSSITCSKTVDFIFLNGTGLCTGWPVIIHGRVVLVPGLVKHDLSSISCSTVAYTSVTFYKVPERYGYVYLVGLYMYTIHESELNIYYTYNTYFSILINTETL